MSLIVGKVAPNAPERSISCDSTQTCTVRPYREDRLMLLSLVAALPVRAVDQPRDSPNWTEIAGLVVTTLGVVATFSAVLVALLGQRWHARRRAPKLTLTAAQEGMSIPGWPSASDDIGSTAELNIFIYNEAGRDPARDVEVFVSAVGPTDDGGFYVAAERTNLFYGRLRSGATTTIASIPPGFSRTVVLAVLGPPEAIRRMVDGLDPPSGRHDSWAALIVEGVRSHACWLHGDLEYRVELVIVGSNFDAVTYEGLIAFDDRLPASARDEDLTGYRTVAWTSQLVTKPRPADDLADTG